MTVETRKLGEGYQVDELDKYSLFEKIRPQLGKYYIRESDQKIAMKSEMSHTVDSPWVHVNQDTPNRCDIWHYIIFSCLNQLPSKCMDCYKVVVGPRTLTELFQLLDIQKLIYKGGACKCGIEQREYTTRLYGGYFYNRSLEAGKENYKEVRALIDEHISPEVPVILKRACTEFELKFGPSDRWEQTLQDGFFIQPYTNKRIEVPDIKARDHWEALLATHLDEGSKPPAQHPLIQLKVMAEWIQFAWRHGDVTAKDHNGGDPLYTPSVTYHDKSGGNNGR